MSALRGIRPALPENDIRTWGYKCIFIGTEEYGEEEAGVAGVDMPATRAGCGVNFVYASGAGTGVPVFDTALPAGKTRLAGREKASAGNMSGHECDPFRY